MVMILAGKRKILMTVIGKKFMFLLRGKIRAFKVIMDMPGTELLLNYLKTYRIINSI